MPLLCKTQTSVGARAKGGRRSESVTAILPLAVAARAAGTSARRPILTHSWGRGDASAALPRPAANSARIAFSIGHIRRGGGHATSCVHHCSVAVGETQ